MQALPPQESGFRWILLKSKLHVLFAVYLLQTYARARLVLRFLKNLRLSGYQSQRRDGCRRVWSLRL